MIHSKLRSGNFCKNMFVSKNSETTESFPSREKITKSANLSKCTDSLKHARLFNPAKSIKNETRFKNFVEISAKNL